MDERQKIDLIAQAVIARLEEQRGKGRGQSSGEGAANPPEVKASSRTSRKRTGGKTTPQRSNQNPGRKRGG